MIPFQVLHMKLFEATIFFEHTYFFQGTVLHQEIPIVHGTTIGISARNLIILKAGNFD